LGIGFLPAHLLSHTKYCRSRTPLHLDHGDVYPASPTIAVNHQAAPGGSLRSTTRHGGYTTTTVGSRSPATTTTRTSPHIGPGSPPQLPLHCAAGNARRPPASCSTKARTSPDRTALGRSRSAPATSPRTATSAAGRRPPLHPLAALTRTAGAPPASVPRLHVNQELE
jgi:hypothetical protein